MAASEAPVASAGATNLALTAALCRRSDCVARALAYALLEWILIALLLANGVFSHLIARFAAFFGLAPPCALCSRLGVDSLFEPRRHCRDGAEPLRRVLCDAHAAEVSRLGYCRAHRRLADAGDMCEDCAAAPGKALLLSWMGRSELGDRDLACACCGVALENGFYSPPFLLPKPEPPRGLKKEGHAAGVNQDMVFVSDEGPVIELFDDKPFMEDGSIGVTTGNAEIAANVERLVPLESIDSLAVAMAAVSSLSTGETKQVIDHMDVRRDDVVQENTVDADTEKLVTTSDDDKVDGTVDRHIPDTVLASPYMESTFDEEINAGENLEGFAAQQASEKDSELKDEDMEVATGDEICENEQVKQAALQQESYIVPPVPRELDLIEKLDKSVELENFEEDELSQKLVSMPMEADVLVSATSYEKFEDRLVQHAKLNEEKHMVPFSLRKNAEEELEGDKTAQAGLEQECDLMPIHSGDHVCVTSYTDNEHAEVKQKSTSVTADVLDYVASTFDNDTNSEKEDGLDSTKSALPILQQISYEYLTVLDKISPDYNVMREETAPDTATHIEGICDSQELLDPKAVITDIKSADSSVASVSSDLESTEFVSIDQLKTALLAARKSLNTLYAELENERNAAAISADQTMAMINRLQEQKAAMQMEAIQYQRLMEEQSEYDQEALQRLNELVVKREKEKQDLERELELYHHKVHLYEAKMRKISRHKADDQNGSSSASSSAEDSDDLSQSFYEGDESAHGLSGSNGSLPTDVVLHETARHLVTLDGSLTDFEEEKLSILEQLKVLEDKLFDLDDDESEFTKMGKHLTEENHLSGESNGFSDDDSYFKLHDKRKGVSCKGKKLLPLFDDATVEAGNHLTKQGDDVDHSTEVTLELAREQDKLAIASEIDHVHERLHALEADRDFIKQCVRSLKRGGKGFDILQEIVHHLRDLRRIEQRTRNSGELSPHYLHPYTD